MAGLQHLNTVGLLGLCKQPFCVLTEFCAYGDLLSYIESRHKRNAPLPATYIMDVLLDIARGLYYTDCISKVVSYIRRNEVSTYDNTSCPSQRFEVSKHFAVQNFAWWSRVGGTFPLAPIFDTWTRRKYRSSKSSRFWTIHENKGSGHCSRCWQSNLVGSRVISETTIFIVSMI